MDKIIIKTGDITKENVCAIVNAANSSLMGAMKAVASGRATAFFSAGNSGSSQFASKLSTFFTSKITLVASIVVAIVSIGTWFVVQNNTTNEKTLNAKKCVKVEIIPININRTIVYDTEKQDVVDNENENQDTDLAETVENNVAENNSNAQDSTEVPTVVVRRTIIINDTVPKNDSTEINK